MRPRSRKSGFGLLRAVILGGLCCLLLDAKPASAQDLRFIQWTIADGLSQSTVYDVLHGPRGFLWIGTRDGLNRFDGHQFRVYRPDPSQQTGRLSHRTVRALAPAADEGLWVGTDGGGLNRFDPQSGRFTQYLPDSSAGSPRCGPRILSLVRKRTGTLFIGTRDHGLCTFDPATNTFGRLRVDDTPVLAHTRVWALAPDSTGALWAASDDGLLRISGRGVDTTLAGASVRDVDVSRGGFVWAATDRSGLVRVDPATGAQRRYHTEALAVRRLGSDRVWSVHADTDTTAWAGTPDAGLYRLRPGHVTAIRYDPARSSSLSDDGIRTIEPDRTGTLWIGTNNGGLNGYAPNRFLFEHATHDPNRRHSLPAPSVLAVAPETPRSVWVGTDGAGLARWDRRTNQFHRSPEDELRSAVVVSILVDRAGHVWIGTDGDGLWRYDPRTKTASSFRHRRDIPASLCDDSVLTLLESASGALWAGTYRGLSRYDPDTDTWTCYRETPDGSTGLRDDRILSLHQDAAGTLWIGTYAGGLHRLAPKDDAPRQVLPVREASDASSARVQSIHEDDRGQLWLGTYNGLHRFNRDTGAVGVYTTEDGLPNNVVYGILPGTDGALWLSTNGGLAQFSPQNLTVVPYTLSDGVQSLEFNGGAYARASDETLFFGGVNGLNAFHPDSLTTARTDPPLVFTSASVMGRPQNVDSLAVNDRALQLAPGEHDFEIGFATLDFSRPGTYRYAFTLEGFDSDWRDQGARRFARYTSVPPGDYTFRVRSRRRSGSWQTEAALDVRVEPAFWQTHWFLVMSVLALGAVCYGAFYYRRLQYRRMKRTRRRIADDLHDDIGSKMSSIALMLDVGRSLPAEEHVSIMAEAAQTARELSGDLRDVVWIVDGKHDTLQALVARLRQVVRQLAPSGSGTVTAPTPVPEVSLSMQQRRHLYLIAKEALHNATQHADASHVAVDIAAAHATLTIEVTDDGAGFDPEAVSSGRGLQTMRHRAEALDGTLSLESAPSRGTTVRVTVDLSS